MRQDSTTCPECGALLVDGKACIDSFHAMLLLEYEVASDPTTAAGGHGEVAHFYAVSSYILQHPEGMNYTTQALIGLRHSLANHLARKVTLTELRPKIRQAVDGPTRITRRAGDEITRWPIQKWPMTVSDIIANGVEGYTMRVAEWAKSIIRALDETNKHTG